MDALGDEFEEDVAPEHPGHRSRSALEIWKFRHGFHGNRYQNGWFVVGKILEISMFGSFHGHRLKKMIAIVYRYL